MSARGSTLRQPTARYQNMLMDSARWNGFPFRDGDIVISTPAKCGTTWTQMICALLVFQAPELPAPLDALSVWPDALTQRYDDMIAEVEAQRHRRFIKTHTPLDGLPFDERVTYVCVGRDPRDAAMSWDNHTSNVNFDVVMAMRAAACGPDAPPDPMEGAFADPAAAPASPRERFWAWVDSPDTVIGLAAMFHQLSTFWAQRHSPNVVLLHYGDLKTDLEGQMRALAGRLGITVDEKIWPDLVRAASFDQMRARADRCAPEVSIWRDPRKFFHRGANGQWTDLLDADDVRRYHQRVDEVADPDLAAWAHNDLLSRAAR